MKRIPASQLTQSHYGQRVTFAIPVRRGQSVQTMTLGHVHVEPPWVIIRAKGAGRGMRTGCALTQWWR